MVPTNCVITNGIIVFPSESYYLFSLLQSNLHGAWAWKYGSKIKTDLRYTPSDVLETFPFPEASDSPSTLKLEEIGLAYHGHRRSLMQLLWLGLTDVYNLFHSRDLSITKVATVSRKSPEDSECGYARLVELRRLHVKLDLAVRDAYGWQDLPLDHDFHEVDILPENDRVRYTISPAARKELLNRLLKLNHVRATSEKAKALPHQKKAAKRRDSSPEMPMEMFPEAK